MFHPDGHLNKHGYYRVGDQCFYSKLDAIKHSVQSGHTVSWYYNDDVFGSLDWKIEPEPDIRELYRRRAQTIRDRYDYVVCMFSGGADSTTVLDSFINNDIHIDEILMYHWLDGVSGDQDSFMNAEITHSALPYLEKHQKALSRTRIRIQDLTQQMRTLLRDPDFRHRSLREVNNVHNIGIISWHYNLHRRFTEYQDLYAQGRRVAFVWGEAKPIIDYDRDQDRHYFVFEDQYPHAPQPRDQEENDINCNYEHFYNDPEFPDIKIKQCHLLLRTMRQISHRSDIFLAQSEMPPNGEPWGKGKLGFDIVHPRSISAVTYWNGCFYILDRNAFNCSIYPDWNFLTYHMDKQHGRVAHPAHEWLANLEPEASRLWLQGFLKEYGKLPEEWIRHRGNLSMGIKRLRLRYDLE